MPQPLGAALESFTATLNVGVLGNVWLVKGGQPFLAIVDRGIEMVGEFGISAARQDRLTVVLSASPPLVVGDTVEADSAHYTTSELLAMVKTQWVIDRPESNDGAMAAWWLR